MAGVISYPTGLDYQQALYNTRLAFQDPALRRGAPVLNQFGMPKAIGGNFASVFTIDGTDGNRWAVKCFTRPVPDLSVRYEQVSKALNRVSSPWKVEFRYLQDGVLCQGQRYPVLKMEWVEATSLLPFVEAHLFDQETLAGVAERFGVLVRDLSRHGIAHGDLQHGNILVTPSGELRRSTTTGCTSPGFTGWAQASSGTRTTSHRSGPRTPGARTSTASPAGSSTCRWPHWPSIPCSGRPCTSTATRRCCSIRATSPTATPPGCAMRWRTARR